MSGNHQGRIDRQATIERMAKVIAQALMDQMDQHPRSLRAIWPDCTACIHWDEKRELCKLVGVRPPAHVIVNGCEQFDTIPF
jgi:hypothetical protein